MACPYSALHVDRVLFSDVLTVCSFKFFYPVQWTETREGIKRAEQINI